MIDSSLLWIGFSVFILIMLILDLGVFHRNPEKITVKQSLLWTSIWVGIAFIFNVFVYYYLGSDKAFEFLTGYIIEKSLSIDNIFVFIIIFSYFQVPAAAQHKVLFWGVAGALVMRIIFIMAGIELIHQFHGLIYIFGAFLIFTGIKLLVQREAMIDPENNPVVRFVKKYFRITTDYRGNNFFVREGNLLWATPLFLVVVLIEASDLIFAVDSIPAILAISDDSFIVYTSNVFAILGLRSLYFALAGIHSYFKHLKYGLAIILVFVGVKMCIADFYKVPIEVSLSFIVLTLGGTLFSSMILEKRSEG